MANDAQGADLRVDTRGLYFSQQELKSGIHGDATDVFEAAHDFRAVPHGQHVVIVDWDQGLGMETSEYRFSVPDARG